MCKNVVSVVHNQSIGRKVAWGNSKRSLASLFSNSHTSQKGGGKKKPEWKKTINYAALWKQRVGNSNRDRNMQTERGLGAATQTAKRNLKNGNIFIRAWRKQGFGRQEECARGTLSHTDLSVCRATQPFLWMRLKTTTIQQQSDILSNFDESQTNSFHFMLTAKLITSHQLIYRKQMLIICMSLCYRG